VFFQDGDFLVNSAFFLMAYQLRCTYQNSTKTKKGDSTMFVRFDYPRAMENMINNFLDTDTVVSRNVFPAVDILEQEGQTTVIAELPGVKKEDVKIEFENAVLKISGERKLYELPENSRVILNELNVRKFNRSIQFEHDVDASKISADLTNGMLKIVLPKSETAKARTIEVK
jgi:HSP20 family molecular chaperone IbpA